MNRNLRDLKIGLMQGRLSPIVDGRIQSFPWNHWENEFSILQEIGIPILEWTIDSRNIFSNPLLTSDGRAKIYKLQENFDIQINSVTCDFFMENPPWISRNNFLLNIEVINLLTEAAKELGFLNLVIPLVDNSSMRRKADFFAVLECLSSFEFARGNVKFLFETDLKAPIFYAFLNELDPLLYGVNLDIGNSASYGWEPEEEIEVLGSRIENVHIKDRVLSGPSVPLGEGRANFSEYLKLLAQIKYSGSYILQTARSKNEQHQQEVEKNLEFILKRFELALSS